MALPPLPGSDAPFPLGTWIPTPVVAGEGGAARVFAVGGSTESPVALKVARQRGLAATFAGEARASLLAEGPCLPRLLWSGWCRPGDAGHLVVAHDDPDAVPSTVWAWIEGASLAEAPPLDRREWLRVVRDAATALGTLHAAGLAHGDVSPSNLLRDAERGTTHLVDLGLATPAGQPEPAGATLRYLDRQGALGDARSRDLLALGVVMAELAEPAVRAASDAVSAARGWAEAAGADPLAALVAPLLCHAPGGRPVAAWLADRAESELVAAGGELARDPAPSRRARIRSAYLRLRVDTLAQRVLTDTHPAWLVDVATRLREMNGLLGVEPRPEGTLPSLDALELSQWLVAVVGAAAAAWPVDRLVGHGDRAIDAAMQRLANVSAPEAWTLEALEGEVGSTSSPTTEIRRVDSSVAEGPDDRTARLALALAAVPAEERAITAIEEMPTAPRTLVLAAVDALRRRGEVGRAMALIARSTGPRDAATWAAAAEVHRRAFDPRAARTAAEEATALGEPTGRARGVLGRLALDEGDLDAAIALASPLDRAAPLEIAVLVAGARGDTTAARDAEARGKALARSSEERARLAGALGYVLAESAPREALAAYREASELAARAGALEEEASYRTGEAATAVSEGFLEEAVATGTRAALLWQARGRPERAARALLACAAAMATAQRVAEADRFAGLAVARARECGDTRAELFAELARLDARREGAARAPRLRDTLARFGEGARASLEGGDDPSRAGDGLRVLARALEAGELAARDAPHADDWARDLRVDVGARLEWWTARAERSTRRTPGSGESSAPPDGSEPHVDSDDTDVVLGALVAATTTSGPLEARGRGAHAGASLAALRGRADLASRLGEIARSSAQLLVERGGAPFAESLRAVPWIARWTEVAPAGSEALETGQAKELLRIVRSLEGRERLGDLLDRVVDALVAWTGVERGLLLLPSPDGTLRPRAARRLGRGDLGPEELALSQTLARRALEAGEPVVAVDASGEMADVHHSVHALRLRSVLAVPLVARGEVLGVVYLDDRVRRGAFGPRELSWARTVAALAATILAEARERVLLRRAVRRARRTHEQLRATLDQREAELHAAEARLEQRPGGAAFEAIVGGSPRLLKVLKTAERIARSDVPVLVVGESGTGKELFARALHEGSPRAKRAFVSENCSAIPETLLESALFGHERGAFTGADRSRTGLFEAADGGTLFLDEIGEMSLGMQAKLLRVLEDGMVRHVGGSRARHVDVRVIAATHRNLPAMVAERTFREDLFYRLNIVVLDLPPLRDRREDVPLLVRGFLARHAEGRGARVARGAMDRLVAFDWPGNVRQLENEIRRALVLAEGVIEIEHLSDAVAGRSGRSAELPGDPSTMRGRIDALENTLVRDALETSGGNLTQAAKALGVSRFGLQKMMKRLGIGRLGEATAPPPRQSAATSRRAASSKSR